MQFGIFTVGDLTTGPDHRAPPSASTSASRTPSSSRSHAEQVGLDVFATGEHHNPPFVPSSPTTTLGFIAAQTDALAAVDLDDPDHHERPGEDRRGLRDPAAPRRRPRRPDDGPRQHRPGLPVVRQGHPRRHPARDRELRAAAPAVDRGRRHVGGQVPHARCSPSPPRPARSTAYRRSSGTARSAAPRSPSRPPTTATASSTTTSSGR